MTKGQKRNFLANMMDKTRKVGEKKKMIEACGLAEGRNLRTVARSLWLERAFDRNVLEHVDEIAEYFGCDVMEMCKPAPQDMLDELDYKETLRADSVKREIANRKKSTYEEEKIPKGRPKGAAGLQGEWNAVKKGQASMCWFCNNTHQFRCELFEKDGKPPKEAVFKTIYEEVGYVKLPRYMVTECKNWVKDRHIKEELS